MVSPSKNRKYEMSAKWYMYASVVKVWKFDGVLHYVFLLPFSVKYARARAQQQQRHTAHARWPHLAPDSGGTARGPCD